MKDLLSGTITPRDYFFNFGIVGLAATIGALFFVFVHQPQQEELASIQAKDEILVKDLNEARKIAQSIGDLRDRMHPHQTDPWLAFVSTMRVLERHVAAGEMAQVKNALPHAIRAIWPEPPCQWTL